MPRKKTDAYYRQRVATLAEDNMRPAAIARILKAEAKVQRRTDCPSERTVGRLYEEHQGIKDPVVKRQAAYFRWPQSMCEGVLPWASSRACLDLLNHRDVRGIERPTVRLARWFWRVTLATPDRSVFERYHYAAHLAAWEYVQDTGDGEAADLSGLEWYLAYQPWLDEPHDAEYKRALIRENRPVPAWSAIVSGMGATFEYETNLYGQAHAQQSIDLIESHYIGAKEDGGSE